MRLNVLHGKARAGDRYLTHLHEPDRDYSLCGQTIRVSATEGEGRACRKCSHAAARRFGVVYIIHFDRPYEHARHYVGWSRDLWMLELRLRHHRNGEGAKLMRAVTAAGIDWHVSTLFYADRNEERRIKNCGGAARHCRECRTWRFTLSQVQEGINV